MTSRVSIVPEPSSDPLNRAVLSTVTGNITSSSFLNGGVDIAIGGNSSLQASATGQPGGADVSYNPGTVTVNTLGGPPGGTVIGLGNSQTFTVPGGQVVVTVNQPTVTESPNGQTATASVAVVTAEVTVGSVSSPQATSTVDLLPLRVSAVAPPGGIDCQPPPPVLETPADGSATNDTTPTFTGLTFPGAQVDIFVDGNPIGTTTANSSGNFTFTPGSPLALGNHQARANAQVNGETSALSDINDFAIDVTAPAAPTLNKPADGEVTNDRTPTFTGRAEPGADVEVFVDGDSIGTTTANGNGDFSFTPTASLAAGPHEAFVGATDPAGNDSPQSNTNGFRIDTEDPAAPGITSPAEGGSTGDSTPTITGTAEPGSEVIIRIDGDKVGSTTADANGNFSFTVSDALSPGEYEVSAIAVDEGGNRSAASDPVSFGVLGTGAEGDDDDDDDQDEDQNSGQNSGQNNGLAQTGGVQGWLPIAGGLSLLTGASILTASRWRRRRSQP